MARAHTVNAPRGGKATTRRALRAVGYVRRSTDRQEQSIPDQKRAIERHAAEHGLRLLRFYADDAISGTSTVRRRAFLAMIADAQHRVSQGRQILIFAEGTRRPPGAPPDYKPGYLALYDALDVDCVPVALNSGVFWPRQSLIRRPGTIVVEVLDPIPPGLPRAEFRERAETAIETASARLLEEAGGE